MIAIVRSRSSASHTPGRMKGNLTDRRAPGPQPPGGQGQIVTLGPNST